MNIKLVGALMILLACGGTGFALSAAYKKEERLLSHLRQSLNFIECELQYRLTPLPELCLQAGQQTSGILKQILLDVSRELEWQYSPDVCSCVTTALRKQAGLPDKFRTLFLQLGHTLGRFDLQGQIQGIQAIRIICEQELNCLAEHKDIRIRSYQTLGLCAGMALIILCI